MQGFGEQKTWDWLDAAPFRAHVRHLMAAGKVESAVVAALAGLSARGVHHLLHGRADGSVVRRICPESAARLYRLTAEDVWWLRLIPVPARRTVQRLDRLHSAGWATPRLALAVGLSRGEVEALLDGRIRECTHLVALRAEAVWRSAEVSAVLPALRVEPARAA